MARLHSHNWAKSLSGAKGVSLFLRCCVRPSLALFPSAEVAGPGHGPRQEPQICLGPRAREQKPSWGDVMGQLCLGSWPWRQTPQPSRVPSAWAVPQGEKVEMTSVGALG